MQQFDNNLRALFESILPAKIAIAVSGGVDSMSLMYLTNAFIKKTEGLSGIQLYILHVNHNLRPESGSEGNFVRLAAEKIGAEYVGLDWGNPEGDKGNLQERAREARYDLLTGYCLQNDIRTILTGHTQDDFIETYLMRKKRKSGVLGLAQGARWFCNDVQILRPAYNIRKKSLVDYIKLTDEKWVEDPTNATDKYERNRVRHEIAKYSEQQIQEILAEIEICNGKAKTLNDNLISAIGEYVQFYPFGVAQIGEGVFANLDLELRINLLSYMLTMVSGKNKMPRFRVIETVIKELEADNVPKLTVHDTVVEVKKGLITIYREEAKIASSNIALENGIVFDNRFQFFVEGKLPPGYKVSKLTKEDILLLKKDDLVSAKLKNFDQFGYKNIKFTLAVIRYLEKIVAIPHIFYYDDKSLEVGVRVVFRPNFISRYTHYY